MRLNIGKNSIHTLLSQVSWCQGELESNMVSIIGLQGTRFRLHRRKIDRHRRRIIYLLRCLDGRLLRSKTGYGMPWVCARKTLDGYTWSNLDDVEALLAIGVVLGLVSVYHRVIAGVNETFPYVIIENVRAAKEEATSSGKRHNPHTIAWGRC